MEGKPDLSVGVMLSLCDNTKKLAKDDQAFNNPVCKVGTAADLFGWRFGKLYNSLHDQRAGMPDTQHTIPLGR